MTDAAVPLTHGPPETVLSPEPDAALELLAAANVATGDAARAALVALITRYPRMLSGWAALGDLGRDPIERYAAYRVGYHRGLDRLRSEGWRGSGYVRWRHETNRGFLASLAGLQAMAAEIGETDEAERCALFLRQLDPSWSETGPA
jgi:hypothetical protein